MKAIIEKKTVNKPYSSIEDLNGKMVEKITTIYFLGLPIFKNSSLLREK